LIFWHLYQQVYLFPVSTDELRHVIHVKRVKTFFAK